MLVAVDSNKAMHLGRFSSFCISNSHQIHRRHFELTQHTYTMDLKRQHVWDYVGDNYVHRLIQNKGDGKLVELRGEGVSAYDIVSISFSFFSILYHVIQDDYNESTSKIDTNQEKIDSMELEVNENDFMNF